MSAQGIVAGRYARALFAAAAERNIVSEVEKGLADIVELLQTQEEFKTFLLHPNIAADAKKGVLKQYFGERLPKILLNTLLLLIDRRREQILPALKERYSAIADEALNQAKAVVYTPFELSDEEMEAVAARFSRLTGKTIQAEMRVDKSLLGGLRVKIGDRLYDGSLSGKLANLEKALLQTQSL
jgi:F-type H+-transporting ATPase subunit delta